MSSRKDFLAAIALLPAAGTFARPVPASAEEPTISKQSARYQGKPHGGQVCASCKYFSEGKGKNAEGTCDLVRGPISPQGWCIYYTLPS